MAGAGGIEASKVSTEAAANVDRTRRPQEALGTQETRGAQEARGAQTAQSGSTGQPVEDNFSRIKGSPRGPKTTLTDAFRRGKVKHSDRRPPSGTRFVQPQAGESLEEALLRDGMYGDEISPAILAQVARMNGIADVRNPGSKLITVFRPEDIYREVRPYDKRPMLEKARFIAVGPHQSWDDVANEALAAIPNDEARRGVIRALKLVNGLAPNAPPPPILVAPDWQNLAGAVTTLQQQGGPPPPGTRRLDRRVEERLRRRGVDPGHVEQTHTAGAMYAPKPGEDLRYAMLATYHRHLLEKGLRDDEAARLLEDYMLVVAHMNGLDTTDVDQYRSIYLPDPERLDRIVVRLHNVIEHARQEPGGVASDVIGTGLGALREARAHADGTAGPPTPRTNSKEDLQSAMTVLFINGFNEEQARSSETPFGWMPGLLGYVLTSGNSLINTLSKMNEAKDRISESRSDFRSWLKSTGPTLSPGKQKRRERVGERVADYVGSLKRPGENGPGLIDGTGFLTFNIDNPQQIESKVRAIILARKIDIKDEMAVNLLIAGLKNQLAGMTKGPTAKIDAYNAMLVAGMGIPRDPTKPVSVVFSKTDEKLLQQALLAEQFEYDPDAVTEAYSALDNPADVPIVASKIRAAVAKLDLTIEEEYRDGLQKALMRHALAIAYLERETRDYDERIKLAAQFIEMELAAGRPVGGPLPPGLAASLDFGS